MPGGDGYGPIRAVRALPADRGGRTPAIAVTAHARQSDGERERCRGIPGHTPKPVDLSRLISMVATLRLKAESDPWPHPRRTACWCGRGRARERATALRRDERGAREAALTSEKTLQRAQGPRGVRLPSGEAGDAPAEFAQAMQAAQAKQQECMEVTARGTARIKERFEDRMALLERVAALGQKAQDINGPVAAVVETEGESARRPSS